MATERAATRTGGRAATTGHIAGECALAVGRPSAHPPCGWKWSALTEVARLETGHTPSRNHPEYWNGDIPWIGLRDATENHGRTLYDTIQHTNALGIANSSARLLPTNTVCLSRTASVGYVVVMGRPMATSQDFVNWVCSESIDYRFLKYVLLAEKTSFLRFASGTTHQTIYFPEVKAFHVCLPPLAEQHAISDCLSALDDKIELNRRMNETLEAMARSLFKSWFVDFDPVTAKAAGKKPFGMTDDLAALFPSEFTDSDQGPIPKGWRYRPVGEVIESVFDGPHATPPDSDQGAVFLGIKNMTGTGLDLSEIRHISEADWPKWIRRVTPRHGDIVFTYEATLGFFALIPPGLRCCLGRRMALVRPSTETAHPHFLFHWFVSEPFQETIERGATHGSTVNRVPLLDFHKYPVVWPMITLVEKFEHRASTIWTSIHQRQEESRQLIALRDSLLPKLLSGEIRLRNAERKIKEVV